MERENPGIMIYRDTAAIIRGLPYEEASQFLFAIIDYGFEGKDTQFDSYLARSVWMQIKSQLDSSLDHYDMIREQNRQKGIKSGIKRKSIKELKRELTGVNSGSYSEQQPTAVNSGSIPEPIELNKEKELKEDVNRERYNTLTLGTYHNIYLSNDQLSDLKDRFPADWEGRINHLSSYMKSHGKTYSDHYATICLWAEEDRAVKQQGTGEFRQRPAGGENFDDINLDLDSDLPSVFKPKE